MGSFQEGDELVIWWLPPDEIVMRKAREQDEKESAAAVQVMEWVRKVNVAINDETLTSEERMELINGIPAPLRHAVAAKCYRTNENITFGWTAAIAGVLSFEVPDLLRAHGVEPEFA